MAQQNKDILTKSINTEKDSTSDHDIFSDIQYICSSTKLITESLRKGCDIVQMPNGDVIVTEVKTINTRYIWDQGKQKMIKLGIE